jgi:hypothetical protein
VHLEPVFGPISSPAKQNESRAPRLHGINLYVDHHNKPVVSQL